MSRVTMRTVAERVGVSVMTVSNAFSRPDQLSAALRERILAAAAELGYVGPDPTARALAGGSSGTVGLLLTESVADAFDYEMSTAFLGAVARELSPSGLGLTLLPPSDPGQPAAGRDVVPARDVAMDGALVYSCRSESPALQWLLKRDLPLVFVDQEPRSAVRSVNVDDYGGSFRAARHLIDLGHRRIGLLTPAGVPSGDPGEVYIVRERRRGWLDAVEAAGARCVSVVAAGSTQEDGYLAAPELLDRTDRPTAVLCFCDSLAAGVVYAGLDRGMTVPGELSVVGFDDLPSARRLRPSLTTVRQDVEAKGRAAATALLAAVRERDGSTTSTPDHVTLPTTLVVRESTAPPLRGSPPR